MYDTVAGIGVDPRNIAQRIMDVSSEALCTCTARIPSVHGSIMSAVFDSVIIWACTGQPFIVYHEQRSHLHADVSGDGSAQWLLEDRQGEKLCASWTCHRQRRPLILQIRTQLAKEWKVDLSNIAEENSTLLRESLASSLEAMFTEDLRPSGYSDSDSEPAEEPAP